MLISRITVFNLWILQEETSNMINFLLHLFAYSFAVKLFIIAADSNFWSGNLFSYFQVHELRPHVWITDMSGIPLSHKPSNFLSLEFREVVHLCYARPEIFICSSPDHHGLELILL